MKNKAILAIKDGLTSGGVDFITNFPGFFSHEIFTALGGEKISINERVAFEESYGASLAGKRSVVTMKNVGLSACADPFLHSIISGVNAGLVIVVTDDIDVVASQEFQDSRPFLEFNKGLWFEPASLQSAYDICASAFEYSEKYDVPVVIRLTNNFFNLSDDYKINTHKDISNSIDKALDPRKYVLYPTYWLQQHDNLIQKTNAISNFVETFHDPFLGEETVEKLLVTVGSHKPVPSEYKDWTTLNIETYPLPINLIKGKIDDKTLIHVIENGADYVSDQLKSALFDKLSSSTISSSRSPLSNKQDWTIWSHLEKVFLSLKQTNPSLVVGDVGQYTVESTNSISACLCLGSSVGVTLGAAMAGLKYPLAIVGDTSFLHSCTQALTEAFARGISLGIIVLDNDGSQATGGQKTIADIRNIHPEIKKVEITLKDITKEELIIIFKKLQEKNELAVVYIKI